MERYLKLEFYLPSSAPHCSIELTTESGIVTICKNGKSRTLHTHLSAAFLGNHNWSK